MFASPTAIGTLILFLLLQAVSLGVIVVGVAAYLRKRRKHLAFFTALDPLYVRGSGAGVLVWVYILGTAVITVLTSVLYFWQPHLL